MRKYYYYAHLTDKEIKAYENKVTYVELQS